MRRDERRAQLIHAAARAFLRGGFAATSLDDIAAEAGVTKVIIYRHFASKRDLYVAVLDDTRARLVDRRSETGEALLDELVRTAGEIPDGFRILYRHARREPEFADYVEGLWVEDAAIADARLTEHVDDPDRRAWLVALLPAVVIDAVLAWLDTGQAIARDDLVRTIRATTEVLTSDGR